MFGNHLKIALRSILKHKIYSAINVLGLTVGIAGTAGILLWVQDEMSFDRFHENRDVIHRVVSNSANWEGFWGTPAPLAGAMVEEIPEIVRATRYTGRSKVVFKRGDMVEYESGGCLVDPAFFEMFSFPFTKGDPSTALKHPHDIVITEALAAKYFGAENPLGQTVEIEGIPTTVTGVISDVPRTSHLKFDFVSSFEFAGQLTNLARDWGSLNFAAYVQVRPDADMATLGQKITDVAAGHNSPHVLKSDARFYLQPLADVHFDGRFGYSYGVVTDSAYVRTLSIMALLVLLVACINFINLSTARSGERAREIGLRKVVGSSRGQLIRQFLTESFVLTFISGMLAMLVLELILPMVNAISLRGLAVEFSDPGTIVLLSSTVLVTALAAGSYPAFYLSGIKPVGVLSGTGVTGRGRSLLRRVLVAGQFSLAIALIIGAAVVYRQIDFISSKDLGFDRENIVFTPISESAALNYQSSRERLLKQPGILAVTAKDHLGTGMIPLAPVKWMGQDPAETESMVVSTVGFGYLEMLGFKLVEGRSFSEEIAGDTEGAFIINEEAGRRMGLPSLVGSSITVGEKTGTIVGVIADAYLRSLHQKIEPLVFDVSSDLSNWTRHGVLLVKIDGERTTEALTALKEEWTRTNPGAPFEYHFLDKVYEGFYDTEMRLGAVLYTFAALAVLTSLLGLIGLTSFAIERRIREIGVRRALGATVMEIVTLMSREFAAILVVANLIAWPVAYYCASNWLENFAYRTSVDWVVLVVSGLVTAMVALAIVATQTTRAALSNPADVLKHE